MYFCLDAETIEHALCFCEYNGDIIQKCTKWLDKITGISFEISIKEFLLGILNENKDEYIDLYNRFFTLLKVFIWESRTQKARPYLHKFISFLKNEILFEKDLLTFRFINVTKILKKRWLDILSTLDVDA